MSTPNFEPDLQDRLRKLEDQQKRLQARLTAGMPFQVLGDGHVFFPSGVEIGGGTRLHIYEPVNLPAPTNVAATTGSNFDTVYIDVSWSHSAGPGSDQVASYLVQLLKDGEVNPIETNVQSGLNFTRFEPVEPNTDYIVRVAAVSRNGRNSTTSQTTVTSTHDTVAPAAPTGVSVVAGVQSLVVKWAPNTERDVANGAGMYRLRVSVNSNLSSPVFDQLINGTVGYISSLTAGTPYYVGLQAVDSSGNQSTITIPLGGPWVPQAIATTDLALAIGGGNIVRNSGFEDGLSNWTTTTGVGVSVAISHGAFGSKSMSITGTGDYYAYQDLTLAQGTWIVSVYSKATSVAGAGSGVVLNWITQSGSVSGALVLMGGTSDNGRVVAGQGTWDWKRLAFQITVTTATAVVRVQPQRGYGGNATGTAYFDEVQAEMGNTITAYAPRADELLSGSITSTHIADNAITTPKLAALSVVAGKIAANSIGTNELVANSVTAAKIATDTITANQIATGAITTNELAANSVTATKIAVNSVDATKIIANTITADRLAVTNSLAVGQLIQSSNYVAGTSGWRINGSGNAEFSNATIRGSAIIGGSINIAGKMFVDNAGGDMHIFSNLEIGSNYSATLYSGAAIPGGGTFGLQVGNDGIPGGQVWTHMQGPIGGNPNWYLAFYDNYGAGKRVWYANSGRDVVKPGPDGRAIIEKRNQDGDFSTKALIVQNGPGGYPGTNGDHAGITFHSPDTGQATILQLVGSVGNALELRNSTNAAFAPIKASAFLVNSSSESKRDISALPEVTSEALLDLEPIQFKRDGTICSYCDDTGRVIREGLQHPATHPATDGGEPPYLALGSKCPLCEGKRNRGSARRSAGEKRTQDSFFFGLTAESVAERFPEAVSWVGETTADLKPDGIDYSALFALLLAHVKKQEIRIQTLEGIV